MGRLDEMKGDISATIALSALGDATRRTIFEKIVACPSTVGDLARGMTVSRSAVSQHLRVLKRALLVIDRPVGTRRIYHLDPRGLLALRFWVDAALPNAAIWGKRTVSPPTSAGTDEDGRG